MSEAVEQVHGPMDPQDVQKLATAIHDLMMQHDPRMDVLLTALAEAVVAFTIQHSHHLTGKIDHQELTKELSRFYSYCVDVGSYKVKLLNAINSDKPTVMHGPEVDVVQPVRE